MKTAADTLVETHKTRVEQLRGPVLQYLMERSKTLKYNGTDQDLYMSVFRPVDRRSPLDKEFNDLVKKQNPGIKKVRDYVNKVNNQKSYPELTPVEWTALKDTASKLGVKAESLMKLINFESGWDPQATNPYSGARGLIQFMPKTAKGMGYAGAAAKSSVSVGLLLFLGAIGYFAAKKFQLI